MYTEAAQICQDIINGKYGQYALESDWTNIFDSTTNVVLKLSGPYQVRMLKRKQMPDIGHGKFLTIIRII